MSLRTAIRVAIALGDVTVNHYGKSIDVQHVKGKPSVNKTANLWYRTHYPEPRYMAPSLDPLRNFTKAELSHYVR